MNFYSELSKHYDEIFTSCPEEMSFINNLLQPCKKLLDIGCATGNKTALLSAPGRIIFGIDNNPEMIRLAKKHHSKPGVEYLILDMNALTETYPHRAFDGILCLGNTLVHLPSKNSMLKLLHTMYQLLVKNGLSILQILNYDRILDKNITSLPILEGESTSLKRAYSPGEKGGLRFKTELHLKQNGKILHNEIRLEPLRKHELSSLLQQVGFKNIRYYGSYAGDVFDECSFVCIAVCGK